MKVLFDNDYCRIIEENGVWNRIDKITNTSMKITSYFDYKGNLIKQNI